MHRPREPNQNALDDEFDLGHTVNPLMSIQPQGDPIHISMEFDEFIRLNRSAPAWVPLTVEEVRVQGGPRSIKDTCPICKDELDRQAPDSCFLDCAHWLHHECVKAWFERGQSKCPECRHPTEKLFRVIDRNLQPGGVQQHFREPSNPQT